MKTTVVIDADLGAIGMVTDDRGDVVLTSSCGVDEHGTYCAIDEGAYYALTAQLLPPPEKIQGMR